MNQQQITSLVATILALALGPGSYIVAKGFLTQDQANQLLPALVTVVTTIGGALLAWWGHTRNSAPSLVAAVNSDSVPGVKVVAVSAPEPQVAVTKTGAVVPDHTVDMTPQKTPETL
jgi:multidrug efflux pump subunit AcrA (membrane-fusion protein)